MDLAEGLHGTEGSNDFKSDDSNTVTDDSHTEFDANAKEVEIVSIYCKLLTNNNNFYL